MKASLTRLLVLLLVPAIWLSTGQAAEATTTYSSPAAQAELTLDHYMPGYTINCAVTGYYAVTDSGTQAVHLGVRCDFGWLMTSAEEPDMSGTFTANGSSCTAPMSLGTILENTVYRAAPSVTPGCEITEICAELVRDQPLGLPDFNWQGCTALAMGPPPAAVAGNNTLCSVFNPTSAPIAGPVGTTPVGGGSPSTYIYPHPYTFNTTLKGAAAGSYLVYFMYGPVGSTAVSGRVGPAVTVTRPQLIGPHQFSATANIKNSQVILGVGVAVSGQGPVAYYSDSLYWDGTQGMLGANDPGSCRFYWGEKFINLAGTDTDEPTGPLDGAPIGGTPTPEPTTDPVPSEVASDCGFSVTDPTTYAGAGICALVKIIGKVLGLLSQLIQLVLGLVDDFLAGLGDLLAALFVPDPASWGFDGLLEQFQTRPPGSVVMGIGDGLGSFRDGYSGAGCGVLTDFSSEDMDAAVTCSNVKSIPGYGALYALVQLGLFALTGLAVFRMMAGKVGGDT